MVYGKWETGLWLHRSPDFIEVGSMSVDGKQNPERFVRTEEDVASAVHRSHEQHAVSSHDKYQNHVMGDKYVSSQCSRCWSSQDLQCSWICLELGAVPHLKCWKWAVSILLKLCHFQIEVKLFVEEDTHSP